MSRKITAVVAIATLFVGASSAYAAPMNGTFTTHYDKQAAQPLSKNRLKINESGAGTNSSPGQPLDNAQVTLSDLVMLEDGQGTVKGTITFTTPNGSTSSAYVGKVMTDAQKHMTSQGTFRTVGGTGAMAGVKGSGSFATAFSSQTDLTSNWSGDFQVPGASAASR